MSSPKDLRLPKSVACPLASLAGKQVFGVGLLHPIKHKCTAGLTGFYLVGRDPNAGFHVLIVNSSSIEPSPQPFWQCG